MDDEPATPKAPLRMLGIDLLMGEIHGEARGNQRIQLPQFSPLTVV
jgi:hypothetical protein